MTEVLGGFEGCAGNILVYGCWHSPKEANADHLSALLSKIHQVNLTPKKKCIPCQLCYRLVTFWEALQPVLECGLTILDLPRPNNVHCKWLPPYSIYHHLTAAKGHCPSKSYIQVLLKFTPEHILPAPSEAPSAERVTLGCAIWMALLCTTLSPCLHPFSAAWLRL